MSQTQEPATVISDKVIDELKPVQLDTAAAKDTKPENSEKIDQDSSSVDSLAVKLSSDQKAKLGKLVAAIPKIVEKANYDEIFGHRINVDSEQYVVPKIRNEILLKFLIANEYDLDVTIDKVIGTLKWRKEFQPLSAAFNEKFDKELDMLGVITVFPQVKSDNFKVGTWNLYGNMKTPKKLFDKFGGEDSKLPGSTFLRWRVGLMEKLLVYVDFTDSTNHKIVQIHDYNNVSLFRADKNMRKSTKEVISIFGDNYPELLSTKFFINIPTLMSWVFSFITSIGLVSEETIKKFKPLNSGNMSEWFDKLTLPKEYNGGAETKVGKIFDLDKSNEAEIPSYGKVILESLNKSALEDIANDVE